MATLGGAPLSWHALPAPFVVGDVPGGLVGDAVYATRRAFASWQAPAGTSLRVRYDGRAATGIEGDAASAPGAVLVRWIAPWPEELGSSDLIIAITRVDAHSDGAITGARIALNAQRFLWRTDGAPGGADVEAAVLHESGHALGLDHPCSNCAGAPERVTSAVMYPSGAYSAEHRALGDDDTEGIGAIYPATTPEPAPQPANVEAVACDKFKLTDPTNVPIARATLEWKNGTLPSSAVDSASGPYVLSFPIAAKESIGAGYLVIEAQSGKHALAAIQNDEACPAVKEPDDGCDCSHGSPASAWLALATLSLLRRRGVHS